MNPAFVLGIDGLPYTLVHRLVKEGVMPNMAALMQTGSLSQMHTTVPDFSCVAWTSFATGVNPGKHGIYGFQDFHPKNGRFFVPTSKDCRASPLWHQVGQAGGRSIILNLPATYPALPLRGKMVAGFIVVDFNKACYPSSFAQTLHNLGYRMELDGRGAMRGVSYLEEILFPVFEARKKAIRYIIEREQWDLCVAVITETDRLQHYLLHALNDPNHEKYEWTVNFYRELDTFIGEVADRLDGKAPLFMVSDHGFEVIEYDIILHDVLKELELVPTIQSSKDYMSIDYQKQAKVLMLNPGRFYINYENSRFPFGFVKREETENILTKIEKALSSLRNPGTGELMVNKVERKEKGFWGDAINFAPDLVAAANPGYCFGVISNEDEDEKVERIQKERKWKANHVWNDAIVYTPYQICTEYTPRIWDVFPSVLAHMGLPIPLGIDGHNLAKLQNISRNKRTTIG